MALGVAVGLFKEKRSTKKHSAPGTLDSSSFLSFFCLRVQFRAGCNLEVTEGAITSV